MSLEDQVRKYHDRLSTRFAKPRVRFAILLIYYLGILVALVVRYGQGDFSTPPFVYQNF
jgi:hypothetical protein